MAEMNNRILPVGIQSLEGSGIKGNGIKNIQKERAKASYHILTRNAFVLLSLTDNVFQNTNSSNHCFIILWNYS